MRRLLMVFVVMAVMAAMVAVMAAPAFAAANTTCKASSSGSGTDTVNNGQGKQARADLFFGGSIQLLQQVHCNPEQAG